MVSQDRSPILFPTHFNKYSQCPERYCLEYQEKRRCPTEFSPSLTQGIAIHSSLAQAAEEYRNCGGVPANLHDLARATVPRLPYPDDASWMTAVDSVVQAVKAGISYLDGESKVLAVEATMHFPYRPASYRPWFTVAAKVDLILLKKAPDGSEFLDVIDYKATSTVREDLIQGLAARITVKNNASTRFGLPDLPIINTTLFLGADTVVSRELTTDECRLTWESMKNVAKAIMADEHFPPNPSPLCQWCPFFENGCSAYPGSSDDGQLGLWLDGAAD